MKRRFFWFLAALPATLAGHSIGYWLAGHQQSDAHHAYFGPALEWSAVLLASYGAYILASALWGRGVWALRPSDSIARTWIKLSLIQVALFALLERAEGYTPGASGFLAQIFVALIGAFAIAYFARVVRRCDRAGAQALRYVRRLVRALQPIRVAFVPVAPAYALSVCAGRSQFSRPPPFE